MRTREGCAWAAGLIASIIAIFVFLTGFENISQILDFFSQLNSTEDSSTSTITPRVLDDGDPDSSASTITPWVLDDVDPDWDIPPFEDTLNILDGQGATQQTIVGFNIAPSAGIVRAISAEPNGEFLLIAENVGGKLSRYDSTGELDWSTQHPATNIDFHAVDVPGNGYAYALTSDELIYGVSVVWLDPVTGKTLREVDQGGYDLVVDLDRDTVWLVGGDIKKLTLELEPQWVLDNIAWLAVSVDYNSDGTVWVLEAEHPDVEESSNRLLKIGLEAEILETIDLADSWTSIVRVNRNDDSVWVGSADGLVKFNDKGTELLRINGVISGIAIDHRDGSVWAAVYDDVVHYSSNGQEISRTTGFSTSQKYIAIK